MKELKCTYCGKNLVEDALFCAYCGRKIERKGESDRKDAVQIRSKVAAHDVDEAFNRLFAQPDAEFYTPTKADLEKYRLSALAFFRDTVDEDMDEGTKLYAFANFAAMLNANESRKYADFSRIAELEGSGDRRLENSGNSYIECRGRGAEVCYHYHTEYRTCYDGGCYSDDNTLLCEHLTLMAVNEEKCRQIHFDTENTKKCFRMKQKFRLGRNAEFINAVCERKKTEPHNLRPFPSGNDDPLTGVDLFSGCALILIRPFGLKGTYLLFLKDERC